MEIKYESEKQRAVVSAMRADQERRGGTPSDLFMHKVLGRSYPAWVTDWPKEVYVNHRPQKQTRYAIDGAGYNRW